MDHIDAKVFTLITLGTLGAVGALKKGWPKWVEGKEEFLAAVLPVVFTVVAKLAGAFKATDWIDALLFAVGAGLGSGVVHDYLLNPVVKGAKALVHKSADAPAK